jgi:hypothetical protein
MSNRRSFQKLRPGDIVIVDNLPAHKVHGLRQAIEAAGRYDATSAENALANVRTVVGDFHEGELAAAMDRAVIVGDIVETWLKRGNERSTFYFCVNRHHAQHVAERFIEAGVTTEYMDGDTSRQHREATFEGFRSSATRLICNVGVPADGIDLDVRCIIDARPTKAACGRPNNQTWASHCPGQRSSFDLAHAGNHLHLDVVTDVGQPHLDDGKERQSASQLARESSEPKPKLCERCKAVVPRASKECPCCGSPIHVRTEIVAVMASLSSWARVAVPRLPLKIKPHSSASLGAGDVAGLQRRVGLAQISRTIRCLAE